MRKALIALGAVALIGATATPALATETAPAKQSIEKQSETFDAQSDSKVYALDSGDLRISGPHQKFDGYLKSGTVEVSVSEGRYYTIEVDAIDIIGTPVQATIRYDRKSAVGRVTGSCTVLKHGLTKTFTGSIANVPGVHVSVQSPSDSLWVQLSPHNPRTPVANTSGATETVPSSDNARVAPSVSSTNIANQSVFSNTTKRNIRINYGATSKIIEPGASTDFNLDRSPDFTIETQAAGQGSWQVAASASVSARVDQMAGHVFPAVSLAAPNTGGTTMILMGGTATWDWKASNDPAHIKVTRSPDDTPTRWHLRYDVFELTKTLDVETVNNARDMKMRIDGLYFEPGDTTTIKHEMGHQNAPVSLREFMLTSPGLAAAAGDSDLVITPADDKSKIDFLGKTMYVDAGKTETIWTDGDYSLAYTPDAHDVRLGKLELNQKWGQP